jgi:hypothetical protein
MKIVKFFLITGIWGKLSELEPEPEFLTSWSRTKMDRLRNTGYWKQFSKILLSLFSFCSGEEQPECGVQLPFPL